MRKALRLAVQGQVSFAVPWTAVDIWPMPVAELEDALAVTVTVPDFPGIHCARPLWLMVAILRLEIPQLPE